MGDDSLDDAGEFSPASAAGMLAGWGSLLAAIAEFLCICGSPRLLFFHASDAAPAVGAFTRFDRLCFVIPAVLAIVLGLVALRLRARDSGGFGILLGFLSLLLINRIGFSR